MSSPILKITDGRNNTIDLLATNTGLLLDSWTPAIPQLKGGGTYQQSVLSDSRQLVMANYENAIETFSLKIHGGGQDTIIQYSQSILRLLENARTYWFTPFQTNPVWLVARAPDETNTRYAIIHNYTQSGLDNPYEMPFFASCDDVAMDNIVIAIERGHWQNVEPGQGECVEIASNKGSSASGVSYKVAAGADDTEAILSVGHTATSHHIPGGLITAGRNGADIRYGLSVRFSSVSIPDDAVITRAYIVFEVAATIPIPNTRVLIIYGDDADDAAAPTNVATWNGKTLTAESKYWNPPFHTVTAGDRHATTDITDILNEIRDRAGWSSGNAMQFFVEEWNCEVDAYWFWASLENNFNAEPELFIEYSVESSTTIPTCDDQVWVVDKSHTVVLSHVYLWDGGVWGGNTIDDATIDLTDDPPLAGDKVYFGAVGGPFSNIVFNVSQEDLNNEITIVWEYWQGAPTSAWTQFGATKIVDKTVEFSIEGFQSVTFVPPMDITNGDWVAADLSVVVGDGAPPAVTAWWIRARVTAVAGTPDVIQVVGTPSNIYTVTWPNIVIDPLQIAGDIPAVARISLDSSGQLSSSPTVRHRVIAALSSNRGPYGDYDTYNFNAYLPFSDEQTPPVMSGPNDIFGDFSFVDDITAPSGRCVLLAPSGTGLDSFYVTVNSLHYFGSYRVFVRVRQIGGSDNDFKVEVATAHAGVLYAQTNQANVTIQSTATSPNWQLLDLGLIDIPTGLPARTADEGVDIEIYVITTIESVTGDLRYMDLILMPTDEWIVDVQDLGVLGFSEGKFLHLDSVSVPKVDLRALTKYGGSPAFAEPLPWKIRGMQMQLPANIGCKIWVVTARLDGADWVSDGTMTAKVQLFSAEQYLGLRGSR